MCESHWGKMGIVLKITYEDTKIALDQSLTKIAKKLDLGFGEL